MGCVDIIPSDSGLASIEAALVDVMNREQMLVAVVGHASKREYYRIFSQKYDIKGA